MTGSGPLPRRAPLGALMGFLSLVPLSFAQDSEHTDVLPPSPEGSALRAEALWPPTLAGYLPAGQSYDDAFPKPESVLGWPVGTWHVRHDQLVRWFEVVSATSDRMTLTRTGVTHEQRPLLLAAVTSPANHARLEELRSAHRTAVLAGDTEYEGPEVVWMGYGVHGNESSASNASLLLAYHLAAATGPAIEAFLEDTIVLIDPCVNPDGGARFAHWANMHRGQHPIGDPESREHNEAWPGGRTNHYWFDLNRDWLLLTHPESRARVEQFQRWMPCVLTDYHEMGSDSTYFFQPGIPSRRNPLTPARNHELTGKVSTFHAEALDAMGSLYFTEQRFDDFYYGKGSTYPDVQGAIGILFEQASSRGHLMQTQHGELSFPFTIRNQFVTSLTTLKAVDEMRDELSRYQRSFYREAVEEARGSELAGWVFGEDTRDPSRVLEMVDRIRRHGIAVYRLGRDYGEFDRRGSFVVPLDQPQARLLRALFELRTSWDDNTFYDVSAWAFPLSFDVPFAAIPRTSWDPSLLGDLESRSPGDLVIELPADDSLFAAPFHLVRWSSAGSAKALAILQRHGIVASVATLPIEITSSGESTARASFPAGTLLIASGHQRVSDEAFVKGMRAALPHVGGFIPVTSGLTPGGPDLGSGSFVRLVPPRPLLIVGSGVSAYEAGEVWHELDLRVGQPVTLLEREDLSARTLDGHTHVILVGGATRGWGEDEGGLLKDWVRGGGHLIATKSSAIWAAENLMQNAPDPDDHDHVDEDSAPEAERLAYGDYEALRAEHRVAGTIFQVEVDLTHPMTYGLERTTLPVFRNFEGCLPEARDPFGTPLRYTAEPLLAGFASDGNVERVAGSPAVRVQRLGRGSVVAMVDNPCFRGVWYGTRRLLHNALYFSAAVRSTGPIEERSEDEASDYDHGHAHDR